MINFVDRQVTNPNRKRIMPIAGETDIFEVIDAGTVIEEGTALNAATFNELQVGAISDAPSDGKIYGRKNAGWVDLSSGLEAFTLTKSTIAGISSQTVTRTLSPIGGAATGALSSGATLYRNDVLSISATAATGYNPPNVTSPVTVTDNITTSNYITAGSLKSYTVTFDLDGGTRTGDGALVQTVQYGGAATPPTCVRSGYNFDGWSGSYTYITGDKTIKALWVVIRKNNLITIRYSGNNVYARAADAVTSALSVVLRSSSEDLLASVSISNGSMNSSQVSTGGASDWVVNSVSPTQDVNYYYIF